MWANDAAAGYLWLNYFAMAGAGSGGARIYTLSGTTSGTQQLGIQGEADAVIRVECEFVSGTDYLYRCWTDYIGHPAQSGGWYAEFTATRNANHGNRCGFWASGGATVAALWTNYRYGVLGDF